MAEKKETTKKPAARKVPKKDTLAKQPKPDGKVNIYSLDGKVAKQITLPDVFSTEFRPDIIRRAVNSAHANRRQAYGPNAKAGMRHSVSWPGKGRGMARTPRLNAGGGRGAQAPNTPGGRRAHPPRPERDWTEKINKKERLLAMKSAIAAVGKPELVKARGHRFAVDVTVPLVVTDDFEGLFDKIGDDYKKKGERPAYAKETIKILGTLGLDDEMKRAREGIHVRAGRGKMRGRRLKRPKSMLFVVNNLDKARKCIGNLPGVDIVTPENLSVELLAPGGDAGRLTVITEGALESLGGE